MKSKSIKNVKKIKPIKSKINKNAPIEFNINYYVYVKLNDRGREILRKNYNKYSPQFPYQEPIEDKNGYCKFQLWDLMLEFGSEMYMGPKPPFETIIKLDMSECD